MIPSSESLLSPDSPSQVVAAAGTVDVLVVNLAIAAPETAVTDASDEEWTEVFSALVHPLPRLFRAVLPSMIDRRSGKILVMGSASALRGMKRCSTYSAARGAQLAFVQAVGVEVAPHNVQVNAIAQNFVDNKRTFRPRSKRIHSSKRELGAKCHSVALSAHAKMRSWPHISVARRRTVSWAKYSPCVADGCSADM